MRTLLKAILLIILGILILAYFYLYPKLSIATGYASKKVCTCVFAEGRELAEVQKNDLYFNILTSVKNLVDNNNMSVTSTFWGFSPKTSVYRSGIGCILLDGVDDYNVKFPEIPDAPAQNSAFKAIGLPTSDIKIDQLKLAIDDAFDHDGTLTHKRTSAVLVIHRDTLVAEKYAKPFHNKMPQLGWSMTKSLMNTFAGILTLQGSIQPDNNNLFVEWQNDERKNISLKQLLQMNSGLDWNEDYTTVSDATKMLYQSEDVSSIALSKKINNSAKKSWYYSSGTTNLLSKYFRNTISNDAQYLAFLKQNLFDIIGMHSAFIETDEKGTFIGSSYGYATPQDWAKFGLLYLHDGVWNNQRLLPEGWVNFTKQAAEGSNGIYGAQFWLNHGGKQYPDAPHDMLIADGYQGQFVFIIPSHDVVIVRMGTGGDHFDVNNFIKNILVCIPKSVH